MAESPSFMNKKMTQKPMVDVQNFSNNVWGAEDLNNTFEMLGEQTDIAAIQVPGANQYSVYDQNQASEDQMYHTFSKKMESAMQQSPLLASAISSGRLDQTIDSVVQVLKPLILPTLKSINRRESVNRLPMNPIGLNDKVVILANKNISIEYAGREAIVVPDSSDVVQKQQNGGTVQVKICDSGQIVRVPRASVVPVSQVASSTQMTDYDIPLMPLDSFPDVPDGIVDGLTMDPFGVDLMLNGNGNANQDLLGGNSRMMGNASISSDRYGMNTAGYMQTNQYQDNSNVPNNSPGQQPYNQHDLNSLKNSMLQLEQKASSCCMQRNWNHQRMSWRIKVKRSTNIVELSMRLKEFRKNLLPFAKSAGLDQVLTSMNPTNVSSSRLAQLIEDFMECITKVFPQVSLKSDPNESNAALFKLTNVIEDANANGMEQFRKLPLSDIISKHPDVAVSLKRLLQKQKLEVVSKLAELNVRRISSADIKAHLERIPAGISIDDDDGNATDMSDSE